jgi:hypothetical protein
MSFSLPIWHKGGFFHNPGHTQAHEYRHLAIILPHLVPNLVPEEVEVAIGTYARLAAASGRLLPKDEGHDGNRSPGTTAYTIDTVQSLAQLLVRQCQVFLPSTVMQSVKLHAVLEHLASDLRLHGGLRNFSAERMENRCVVCVLHCELASHA